VSNYNLSLISTQKHQKSKEKLLDQVRLFSESYLQGEKTKLAVIVVAVILNTAISVFTPFVMAFAIDHYLLQTDLAGLLKLVFLLVSMYFVAVFASYFQAKMIGRLSQRTLFRLRQNLFAKIQSLPIAFFIQNKSGDLISRLNNDTDKLNQFLSESAIRFVSIMLSVVGIGIIIFFINIKMALLLLSSTILVFIFNLLFSSWVEKTNKASLVATGNLTAEINESLANYKAIVVFNKQDYLVEKIAKSNQDNYQKSVLAQVASGLFRPLYDLAGNLSQLIVLGFGIFLISKGEITVGVLVGFLSYSQRFYEPLRILGSIWGSFQSALAAWSRVREIFGLKNDLEVLK
jgi:ATP-binding cassette subfamily B protein